MNKIKLTAKQQKLMSRLNNPLVFKLYLLFKVPMGFLSGMKIVNLDSNAVVSLIKYKWINRNPFRTTYFASLSMAAELTTGTLALIAAEHENNSVATFPISMKADFIKAAKGNTVFTCDSGNKFFEAVEKAVKTGEAVIIDAVTVGRDSVGNDVCRFTFTWSFKKRSK